MGRRRQLCFTAKQKPRRCTAFLCLEDLLSFLSFCVRELEFKRAVVDIEGIEQILIIDAGACQIRVIATFPVGAPTGLDA